MSSTPAIRYVHGVVTWRGGMAIDADGSPRAYAAPPLRGLDYLANAGAPGKWWGIAVDVKGEPFVQTINDPAPGYYVSTTSLQDASKPIDDPRRYVNSETVPYIAVPRELVRTYGVRMGDFAMVCRGDRHSAAVVADIGPAGHFGEGSIALAERLKINSSPRKGGCTTGVVYLIWAGSGRGWPLPLLELEHEAGGRFTEWGGEARVRAVYP